MQLADFDYALPAELIAQTPAPTRDGSRLLVVGRDSLVHARFDALVTYLRPGDLLVLNDTRVIRARLRGAKDSGGQAELLVERIEDDRTALCQVRVSKPLHTGRTLKVGASALVVEARVGEFYRLRFPEDVLTVLERHGEIPLPPYIERPPEAADEARYQTVYGSRPGAVAAPTAGLHFTPELLAELPSHGVEVVYVTLHVGAGTFQPVRTDDLAAHRMHHERFEISARTADAVARCRARGGRVVAVGTTVVRTLESAAAGTGRVRACSGETDLFITPGYRFQVVDALLTNFHLPKSTLMMLVTAFGGYARVMAAYRAAVAERYRFFSYGDAMFLECSAEQDHARL
ncbi:MAG: tRNA preQ1(34) S-adenosylmethionine ribosyltransferase-isomerase QueA [Pseudomonadales bacterium]|nr:tRNA preQ1(34) S-adenosylmethionine ribosyltransferase-isomerase QueA [Pseudomonadales bacterium]